MKNILQSQSRPWETTKSTMIVKKRRSWVRVYEERVYEVRVYDVSVYEERMYEMKVYAERVHEERTP